MKKHFFRYTVLILMFAVIIIIAFSAVKDKEAHVQAGVMQRELRAKHDTVINNTYAKTVFEDTYANKPTVTASAYPDNPQAHKPAHSILSSKKGSLYIRGNDTKKLLALTFDDGPDKKNTPLILDILKKYNVKATFFVIGKQIEKFPEAAKRIVAEGHEIGNHSYSHVLLKKENRVQVKEELLKADQVITKIMGIKTKIFRPPFGIENPEILSIVGEQGYDTVLWTVDTDDWKAPPVTKLINYEINHAKNGAIILMHSGEGQRLDATIQSLPHMITILRQKGYEFVTVSEIIGEQE